MGRDHRTELLAVALWAGYCAVVSIIGASDHFELTFFLWFVPAQFALGYAVPRGAVLAVANSHSALGMAGFRSRMPMQ